MGEHPGPIRGREQPPPLPPPSGSQQVPFISGRAERGFGVWLHLGGDGALSGGGVRPVDVCQAKDGSRRDRDIVVMAIKI